MEKKKITLEDLKLESFLTEIDNSKLVNVQGGNGAYEESEGGCGSEIDDCDITTTYDDQGDVSNDLPCDDQETNEAECQTASNCE